MKSYYNPLRIRLSMTAFLILCVFCIQSCKKDDPTIGLGIQPEGDALGVGQNTVVPTASIYRADSIRTDELAEAYVGNYNDDEFGQTKTEYYCQLELPGENLDLGDPAFLEVDSVVLTLKTSGRIIGSVYAQDFSVYTLTESISVDSVYFSDEQLSYSSTDLVKPGESLVGITNGSLSNRVDSVYSELRIPIDKKLGQLFINQYEQSTLESDENFQAFFPGLAIVSNTLDGGIIGIDPNSGFSALNIYYHDLSLDVIDVNPEALVSSFQIDNNSAYYNYFERDYSTTSFGDFTEPQDATEKVHLQGVDGIMAKLDFSEDFPEVLIGDDNLVLSRAQLVLPISSTGNDLSTLPSVLFLSSGTRRDSLKILIDQVDTDFSIGGFYSSTDDAYIFDIPLQLQNVFTGNLDLEPMWISVNPPERLRTFFSIEVPTYTRVIVNQGRVILNGPEFNSQDLTEKMRLVLTYSE